MFLLISIAPIALAAAAPGDAASWFAQAQEAREQRSLDEALEALSHAEDLGFAPVRVAFERARVHTLAGDTGTAIAELGKIAAGGFSAVGFITNDPILRTLRGDRGYDDLVAEMTIRAYPCEHDESFRAFDFWVGDWDVRTADGRLAGNNSVTVAERGCVLLENWTSASGSTGRSVNYLDKQAGEWVQVWIAEGGSQIHIRGGMTEKGMLLTGALHSVSSGETVPFRGLWTLLEDGRVRQYFEQSNDDGQSWTPWFEGFYSRQK